MDHKILLEFLHRIEKLKCNTRHSWTSSGRQESVAEHSWRLSVMAMLCADEYPDLDMNKVIRMCLIHDFGEAITGDIPSFLKTEAHERAENTAVRALLSSLPENTSVELTQLFQELTEGSTAEARLCMALDKIETLISHNEADLSTWLEKEYTESLVYGDAQAACSEWTQELRETVRQDTRHKIGKE